MSKFKQLDQLLKELLEMGFYCILIPTDEIDEDTVIIRDIDIDPKPN